MPQSDDGKTTDRSPLDWRGWIADWRGWIALAWVLWWGWAYGAMAIEARSPQVLAWLRTLGK